MKIDASLHAKFLEHLEKRLREEPALHECSKFDDAQFECYQQDNKLVLSVNGEYVTDVEFCPFCGIDRSDLNRKYISIMEGIEMISGVNPELLGPSENKGNE